MLTNACFLTRVAYLIHLIRPGIRTTWKRLLQGECGLVSTQHLGPEFTALPSQVAGIVPVTPSDGHGAWVAGDHVSSSV